MPAQLGLRNLLKRPMRKRLRRLAVERNRLLAAGLSTAEIDAEIRYWKGRAGNEPVFGAANAWLTPFSNVKGARRIARIRRKRQVKEKLA